MSFGIIHYCVEWQKVVGGEEEVEVLERFGLTRC